MKKSGGRKKHGRNRAKCQTYRAEKRREKHKLSRQIKRLRGLKKNKGKSKKEIKKMAEKILSV